MASTDFGLANCHGNGACWKNVDCQCSTTDFELFADESDTFRHESDCLHFEYFTPGTPQTEFLCKPERCVHDCKLYKCADCGDLTPQRHYKDMFVRCSDCEEVSAEIANSDLDRENPSDGKTSDEKVQEKVEPMKKRKPESEALKPIFAMLHELADDPELIQLLSYIVSPVDNCKFCGSVVGIPIMADHVREHYEDANKPIVDALGIQNVTPDYSTWPKPGQRLMLQRYLRSGRVWKSPLAEQNYLSAIDRYQLTLKEVNADRELPSSLLTRIMSIDNAFPTGERFYGLQSVIKDYAIIRQNAISNE
jgi:hypothetical protein